VLHHAFVVRLDKKLYAVKARPQDHRNKNTDPSQGQYEKHGHRQWPPSLCGLVPCCCSVERQSLGLHLNNACARKCSASKSAWTKNSLTCTESKTKSALIRNGLKKAINTVLSSITCHPSRKNTLSHSCLRTNCH